MPPLAPNDFRTVAVSCANAPLACAANPLGQKIKEPFSGSKYESTNRYYRATGKGTSKMDAVATSQAEIRASPNLEQQAQTFFELVTNYEQNSTTN